MYSLNSPYHQLGAFSLGEIDSEKAIAIVSRFGFVIVSESSSISVQLNGNHMAAPSPEAHVSLCIRVFGSCPYP